MVVKEKRGRRRYVVFMVAPSIDRGSLIARLKRTCGENAPYVVQCGSGWAVVRCAPGDVEDVTENMSAADPSSVSICTSGTLKTLRERYPELKSSVQPRPRATR
jgi:hypothetical protein